MVIQEDIARKAKELYGVSTDVASDYAEVVYARILASLGKGRLIRKAV